MSRSQLLLTAVLLAAAGSGFLLGQRAPLPPPAAIAAPPAEAAVAAAAVVAADLALPTAPALPQLPELPVALDAGTEVASLPAADTSLLGHFDALLARAKAGDAAASCRLAVDLDRCRLHRQKSQWSRFVEQRAVQSRDASDTESMVNAAARMQEQLEQDQAFCQGIGEQHLSWGFAAQQAAARANPALRVWAASQPALDLPDFVNQLEAWQSYRATALPWLQEAALGGDLAAQILLARVYGDDRRPGPQVPPFRRLDDARFVTWATVLERRQASFPAVQRAAEQAASRLPAEQLQAALAEVDRLLASGQHPTVDKTEWDRATRESFEPRPPAERCQP